MSDIIDIYGLSPLQKGILFHTLYDQDDDHSFSYIVQVDFILGGRLDVAAFEKAWEYIIHRHEILRSVFVWEEVEKPLQAVYQRLPFTIRREDWSALPCGEREKKLQQFLNADRRQGFSLDEAPLMRITAIKEAEEETRIIWTHHHILLDGWSVSLVFSEVMEVYFKMIKGEAFDLPKSLPYKKYIQWINKQDRSKAEKFWTEELKGFHAPTPLMMERNDQGQEKGYGESVYRLSEELTETLKEWVRNSQLTLNTLVQGAWAYLMSRYSGESDIVFGVTSSGRPAELVGAEKMVGLFINTLPTRIRVTDDHSLVDWLRKIQMKELERRQYEYNSLVDIQGWSEVPRGSDLFRTLYVFENYPIQGERKSDLSVLEVQSAEQTNYPLTLIAMPDKQLTLKLMYDRHHFDEETIQRIQGHLSQTLIQMTKSSDPKLSEITHLTMEERTQLLEKWNDTQVDYSCESMIHALFEQQVEKTPEAIAVMYENEQLTYKELNERANQLAHYLQKQGVGPESLVGVYMERSPEMMIGLLGILKSGGAYVPLDPTYPEKRLRYILEDARIEVLVTQERLEKIGISEQIEIICMDQDRIAIEQEEPTACTSSVTGKNLAYVMYTSGSTGKPKGVMIEHHSVINYLEWMQHQYPLSEKDVVLQKTPISFDVSVWELFWGISVGACVSFLPPGGEKDPSIIAEVIEKHRVTIVQFVPSMLSVFIDHFNQIELKRKCSSVRHVFSGGEELSPGLVRRFQQYWDESGQVKLTNFYGPTEATIYVNAYDCQSNKEFVSIGNPIQNIQLYVFDQNQRLQSVGIEGELYIGGAGLARGYLNRPDLTAERFVPHPFQLGERLYRTGDLVRYLTDGNLKFIGRMDHQVKVRGFRIELGEIEATLERHTSIKEAVVIVREDRPGDQRLVAYVISDGNIQKWREYLQNQLPNHMVPAHLVELDYFPLTPNGKIDRKALPEPEGQPMGAFNVLPRTPSEELIAAVWSQVLGIENIGSQDSFFERGGHSLLATQIVSRLQEAFQIKIPLRELFKYDTVEALAKRLDQLCKGDKKREIPPLIPMAREESIPLSYAQKRLWFIDQLTPNSAMYNIHAACRLTGKWSLEALETGWNQLIERHESLRTVIQEREGQPIQQIQSHVFSPLPQMDLTILSLEDREREMKRFIQNEAEEPFHLGQGPLIRTRILKMDKEEWILLCTMHHIISDGWSMGILLEEWMAFYEGALGKPVELKKLPVQYADFALWQKEWQKEEDLDEHLQYWKEELHGELPVLQLPMDRPRPSVQTHRGASQTLMLPYFLREKLKELSQQEGTTFFMTLMAAYQSFLARYTGQDDILVGSPIANRNVKEIEGLIGFFVNTLVYRADFSGNPTFQELLSQIRIKALKAYEYQDIPFERVVEAVKPERNTSHSPIFQTMFTLQNTKQGLPQLFERNMEMMESHTSIAKFDLSLFASETEEGLLLTFEYNTDLFNAATIERMAGHFEHWLSEIVSHPKDSLTKLNMLPKAEYKRLLEEWNDTDVVDLREETIHTLFEEQVEKTPEAIAVVCEDEELTYRELDERSNQLAHYLHKRGVGCESLVGISVTRSSEMIVGLLGIMKSGGAYVPIDPSYPESRLRYILADAHIEVLVTQEKLPQKMTLPESVDMICIDRDRAAIEQEVTTACTSGVTSDNLAYIIYTSGSTGNPKGVMIEHRSALTMIHWAHQTYSRQELAGVLASTSLSFDLSVFEVFVPLTMGGKVIVAESALHLDKLSTKDVTLVNTVPSAAKELVRANTIPSTVKVMNLAGEPLPQSLVEHLYESSPIEKVYNLYGPSEDTTYSTYMKLEKAVKYKVPPIGRPISNTEVYVLSANQQMVPIGVAGELYIGGSGLARGYLNRPDLTNERFIPHPFKEGERVYRTGDLVRYLPDGTLDYLGRIDHQVKIRGFRIELGEIEATLQSHSSVNEVVVMVREDHPGDQRLVAYVVGEENAHDWRDYLKTKLPNYMVPAHFVGLTAFPLTPNGKIDRKALPAPERKGAEGGYVAPRTPTEVAIVSIWHQVLGTENIGIHDSFFELGGHSLLATQAVTSLKEAFGIELPLHDLFTYTTVQELAERVNQLQCSGNEQAQNDSKGNVSFQDYIQKETAVSNDEELLELLKQLEELSEEEAQGIFESNLVKEGVKK
ncbi:amino acid adenylation domain-containing protein [Peribacillus simplex]|uniref:Amino acid adenylation domain-containing protein n=1 Tax=Peribacillus simplex TaxID=1478 RepID=A0AAW7IEQ3_9BACI|nr:non-ribosomal peptide synthetase [Peribacillus simplex]MDM5294858.1 amino acid adenylation domain-containing protein [Peribacillus simplex]MDM5453814.1 amino acid adenylation domain-containing protein [Peribacillus simplex]